MNRIENMLDVMEKYIKVRTEIEAYSAALEIIAKEIPKSELIMPIGTKIKDLFGEILELPKRLETYREGPESTELREAREMFLAVHNLVMNKIDKTIERAEQ